MPLTISQRDELGRFTKRLDSSPRPSLAPRVANNKSADAHDLRAGISYDTAESASDTETFDGPALWFIVIALICGLIAFGATKL